MADKRYNLKMTLTDGTELSAGVITAPQGPSAYQIAVDNGFEGTESEWLDSLKGGPQGPTGPTGPQGETGDNALIQIIPVITAGEPEDIEMSFTEFSRDPKENDCFVLYWEDASTSKMYICFCEVKNINYESKDFTARILYSSQITGEKGDTGVGIPDGGTAGQFLQKTAEGTTWADSFEVISTERQETTVTITGSSGSKQIEIIADVENITSGKSSLAIRKDLFLIILPDGSSDNAKQILLNIYEGAISTTASQGIEMTSITPVVYNCYTTSNGSQTKITIKDYDFITYPNGLSIANLPDTAQVQAIYGVQGIRKVN